MDFSFLFIYTCPLLFKLRKYAAVWATLQHSCDPQTLCETIQLNSLHCHMLPLFAPQVLHSSKTCCSQSGVAIDGLETIVLRLELVYHSPSYSGRMHVLKRKTSQNNWSLWICSMWRPASPSGTVQTQNRSNQDFLQTTVFVLNNIKHDRERDEVLIPSDVAWKLNLLH